MKVAGALFSAHRCQEISHGALLSLRGVLRGSRAFK
jgi:hypothetical protein